MFARAPGFAAAEPQLFVADIKASCDFFTHKLGFVGGLRLRGTPFSGQVMRDGGAALGAKALVVKDPDGNLLLFRRTGGLMPNGRNA
jgi:hypothetical protein